MKGIFKTPIIKYIFCLLFIVTGTFIAIKFGLWGVDTIHSGKIAISIFCFIFALLGILLCLTSIFLFKYNKGAYLVIDENKIDARCGYEIELHELVSNIRKVELLRGETSILLYFSDWIYQIINLENAKEIYNFIISINDGSQSYMTVDEATSNLTKHRNKYIKLLVLTLVFVVLLFVHIVWCVLLTKGKNLGDFSQREDIVFVGFAFAELITVIVTFIFANKCGKQNKIYKLSKLNLLTATAIEHKYESIERYQNRIGVKFFDDYTYRIIMFKPEIDVFAYTLERFDLPSKSWIDCYDEPKVFDHFNEMYDDIEETFEDFILQD